MSILITRSVQVQATRENIATLATFQDEHANAVSFYFSVPGVHDRSHHEEIITLKQLVRKTCSDLEHSALTAGILKDFEEVLTRAKETRLGPTGLNAIFACHDSSFWLEFELPMRCSVSSLEIGTHFHLLPLVRAMEACTPYCIVLAENGKARCFVARGDSILELAGCLPEQTTRMPAADSRVGWSHHVEGNQREHDQEYLRELASALHGVLAQEHLDHLVIGCREDLWNDLKTKLLNSVSAAVIGHFHLPGFEMTAEQCLHAARPIVEKYRSEYARTMLQQIREDPRHAAIGIDAVLQAAEEARIQTLVLGCAPQKPVLNQELRDNQRETILRKALLSEAEILTVETDGTIFSEGVAALLRY